ncbi:D-alanine--poly(phosphoribitol) ligase subunit 1 [Listeria newyorkensis]|uniref:D-alanine--D-alanyl carrier protein ligase n=1 Tax=Listeria newyorkensis TaxID=1497681 RepID=A0ABX4XJ69_9LIST|nr:D-alanine--poly(phosphoribitol) ligase subunit DltA [Listeria newyorkensis]PNP88431.1 D-alanine--poly(phosphoribitol) ligase subunit 1 [Listeria newyorkensis]WAO20576.1 D-alanine--poly(phosphoribitol) ligase subunit DltA [Listeria newyorkensis]SQC56774.1 D-alanine--poly(phosphoribitol) ligase subunit 1 [Listeria newyorkensis]
MSVSFFTTSINERIDEWAMKTPNKSCYDYNGNSLTYRELKEQSDALAVFLLQELADDLAPILVYGHMDATQIVAFLACSKAGRAYVPIDASMPADRIKQITEVAQPSFILCTDELPVEATTAGVNTITSEQLQEIIAHNAGQTPDDSNFVKAEDNYYIIFTSGSTGVPKGVQISHNNLVSFTNWILQDFQIQEGARFLNQAPYSFDLSVMDLYPCLLAGGTLVPLDKTVSANLKSLYEAIPNLEVNVWVSTPSFVDICLMDPNFNGENNPSITHFLFCGEVLTKETAQMLINRFPKATVYNTYGPTEATVAVTNVVIDANNVNTYPSLPLGRIKPDTRLAILDEDGLPVPNGEKGEIVLIGPSVSKGYLNEPEKTDAVFYTDEPFQAYKTGDCGTIIDGMLFFQGRLDFQIKLHGYRIELEDIENNLKEVSYIRSCIVVPKMREGKVDSLVAFVVPSAHDFEKEYKLSAAIKKELAESMPSYMIPRKWVYKEELPLTMNGKIDRKQLSSEVNT